MADSDPVKAVIPVLWLTVLWPTVLWLTVLGLTALGTIHYWGK